MPPSPASPPRVSVPGANRFAAKPPASSLPPSPPLRTIEESRVRDADDAAPGDRDRTAFAVGSVSPIAAGPSCLIAGWPSPPSPPSPWGTFTQLCANVKSSTANSPPVTEKIATPVVPVKHVTPAVENAAWPVPSSHTSAPRGITIGVVSVIVPSQANRTSPPPAWPPSAALTADDRAAGSQTETVVTLLPPETAKAGTETMPRTSSANMSTRPAHPSRPTSRIAFRAQSPNSRQPPAPVREHPRLHTRSRAQHCSARPTPPWSKQSNQPCLHAISTPRGDRREQRSQVQRLRPTIAFGLHSELTGGLTDSTATRADDLACNRSGSRASRLLVVLWSEDGDEQGEAHHLFGGEQVHRTVSRTVPRLSARAPS